MADETTTTNTDTNSLTFKAFKGLQTDVDPIDSDAETTPEAYNVQIADEIGIVQKRAGVRRLFATSLQRIEDSQKECHRVSLVDESQLIVVVDNSTGYVLAIKQNIPTGRLYATQEADIEEEAEAPVFGVAVANEDDDTVTLFEEES